MLQEDHPTTDIASQMSAVRKALDSTYVRMTVGYLQQELRGRLKLDGRGDGVAAGLLDELQGLLAKVR
jgi:DNA-binding FrmR family transcriptional regulator